MCWRRNRPADAIEPLAALLDDHSDQVRAMVVSLLAVFEDVSGAIRAQLSQMARTDRNPMLCSMTRFRLLVWSVLVLLQLSVVCTMVGDRVFAQAVNRQGTTAARTDETASGSSADQVTGGPNSSSSDAGAAHGAVNEGVGAKHTGFDLWADKNADRSGAAQDGSVRAAMGVTLIQINQSRIAYVSIVEGQINRSQFDPHDAI